MELFIAEERKIWRKAYGFWLVFAVLILKIFYLEIADRSGNRFILENRDAYLSIVSRYEGKITDSVAALIEAENSDMSLAAANLKKLRSDFNAGAVTAEEFEAEADRLEKYVYGKELYFYFFSRYLTARADPERRYLLFNTGWDRFFSADRFDWFTAIAAIVFAALVFGKEYEADMRRILISTVKGNRDLTYAKYLTYFSSVFALCAASFFVEWVFFQVRYGLPNASFPFQSLDVFQNSELKLSLFQAGCALFLIRFAGFCALGTLVMTVTVAAQSVVPALIAGLGLITLPYALPLSDSLKAFLPAPFSLIVGVPFLAWGNSPAAEADVHSAEIGLTKGHIIAIALFWVVISVGMLSLIRRQFCHVEPRPVKTGRKTPFPILLLILPLVVSGCAALDAEKTEPPLTFNFGNEAYYSYADPYIVSLFPAFMIEDLGTGVLDRVVRDPFLDEEYIYKYFAGIFVQDHELYYSVTTDDHDEINAINLKTWDRRRIYHYAQPQAVKLLNDDLETHRWSLGKRILPFMIYGDSLFIYSDHELKMINLKTSRETRLIRHILYPSALAFRNGKFYYTNEVNELRVFSLSDRSDLPLMDVRSEFSLYIRGDSLYFFDLDRAYALYSVDLETNQSKKILASGVGEFACDDRYIYFVNQNDDGKLYRADLTTGDQDILADLSYLTAIQVIDGTPFLYVRAAGGMGRDVITYRINRDDWSSEELTAYEEFALSLR